MFTRRTICSSIVAIGMFIGIAETAPFAQRPNKQATMRIGTHTSGASSRGMAFTLCNQANQLVSENLDTFTITPGNSVSCFGGTGTPEHSYGRSHDLSLGDTAGQALDIICVHFALAQNSVAGNATVKVYLDQNGTPGPTPDGSDLWLLGTLSTAIPATAVPVTITASATTPISIPADSLVFIEIVIPASFPGTHEIGSNAGGELSPSWLKTTNGDCGIGSWINPSVLGFPSMAILEAIEVGTAIVPDPCNSPLPSCSSDVDGDGFVAVSDILAIIASWGVCGDGTFRPTGDIAPLPNGDCCVDVGDVLAVIGNWGMECNVGSSFGINEIRIDMTGTDTDEFIELIGDPGTVLDGYSYIVIGDGAGGSGVLETVIDLTGAVIPADGLLSIGDIDMVGAVPDFIVEGMSLENSDNVTHMLVGGLTALLNDDLDADDDGNLDAMFWAELVDEVGLLEVGYDGEVVDLLYTDVLLGPVGIYPPAHVFRCPDGDVWFMGVFGNLAMDTPGDPNMCDEPDLDGDGIFDIVDNCYLANPEQNDCNGNGIGDVCDIAELTSQDCNGNGIPDECEEDCNGNGIPDECDIANGAADCDENGVLDSCEPDCNENGIADACDIANGDSTDDNDNGIPDECEEGNLVYTSFEEPGIGAQYVDPGDPLVDHQLVNNIGQSEVEHLATGAEMGFTAWYVNTRDGVGLTDGDYVGATDYTGTVGAYTDGLQGYQMSDCDGMMLVQFDTVLSSGAWNVSLDLFVQSTGWEADDAIVVDVVVDGGAVLTILDSTGQDIDDMGIEGVWFNLLQDLTGYTEATLRVSLDSNSGTEAIFLDNVVFSSNAIEDTDGDGIPDSQDNCDLPNPGQEDCNGNGIGDVCDLADGTSLDCNLNSIPDECEADCNTNGVPDDCDIANGTSLDADGNGIPDECEVANLFLVITGVYDAELTTGAGPKGAELYVLSDIDDLSLYGIGGANNGGGTDGEEFTFPPISVVAGTYIYVTDDEVDFQSFFGFAADYQSGAMSINGDDAIELFENGIVIDTFGDIDMDGTGTPWDYLDGWVKRISMTGPDGAIFSIASWTFSGIYMLEGDTNAATLSPFPIGGFTP
ncbi:MAG: hypothetical protein HOJ00_09105 [Phycisphaerae bacterium]|nr:hypothetical protein [Phycisphaerae bacterium]